MKVRYNYWLLVCLLTVSCSDFLEPASQSDLIPRDITAMNEILLGQAYPNVEENHDYFAGNYMNAMLALLDDDISYAPFAPSSHDIVFSAQAFSTEMVYTWQPDMYKQIQENGSGLRWLNAWGNVYKRVLGANAVLDYVDGVDGTEQEKAGVKAQALALRAHYFFYLVNLYGVPYNYDKESPGIVLKINSGLENKSVPRSSVAETYDRILKDLLEAERLYLSLPLASQWKKDFRTSLPMVQLLLSRVYLYMENWNKAAEYAAKVMNDYAQFSLVNLNQVAGYYNFCSMDCSEAIWVYGSLKDYHYLIENKHISSEGFPYMMAASVDLVNSFKPGDLRKEKLLIEEIFKMSDQEAYYRPYAKIGVGDWESITSAYEPLHNQEFARSYRLAEAYLNFAEAVVMMYKQGDASRLTEAYNTLNTLRINRLTPDTYREVSESDPDKLLEFVRDERRRELCFESHRWFDLRRYGMPKIKHKYVLGYSSQGTINERTYVLEEKDAGYTLPLMPSTIEDNPALVQNPVVPERRPVKN